MKKLYIFLTIFLSSFVLSSVLALSETEYVKLSVEGDSGNQQVKSCPEVDKQSSFVKELDNYASCVVGCDSALDTFTDFSQQYGEVPIGCDVYPCCRKSVLKKDPDCTNKIIALKTAKDAACASCNIPESIKDPIDGRPPWVSINSTLEEYINSEKAKLTKLQAGCSVQEKQLNQEQEQNQGEGQNQETNTDNSNTPSKIGDLPSKQELKQGISQTNNLEQKLDWAEDGQDTDTPTPKTKGKNAYIFVQPGLTDFERFSMAREMAKWEKQFKKDGYNVIKVEWTEENYKKAFTDSDIGAFDYYGHNGLDTGGSWLSKRMFKLFNRTSAIFGHDADDLRNLIYNAKYEEYVKTMSPEEAHERAWAEKDNLGAEIVNIHACYSADNDSLKNVLTKNGGTFRGEEGPYYGFDSLDITTTK